MKLLSNSKVSLWGLFFILFLLFISKQGTCQNNEVVFEKLTIRDGLSHNNVYTIIQDSLGYMWFGTQDGLNRYDGQSISVFRHDPTNPNSLSTGNFGKIHQDRHGYYWFGTFGGGIDRYDPKTNTFKNYPQNPKDPNSISNNQILFIFEDRAGTLWFGTPDGGLNRFNRETDNFTRFQSDPNNPTSLSHNRAKCMCQTSDGTLWVGTLRGLNKFNEKDGSFKNFTHNPANPNSLGANIIQNMVVDNKGIIWIATYEGGLNRFDPSTNTFKRFTNNPNNQNSISDNKTNCIFIDSENYIWIGTYDGGLNKFDPNTETFTHYKHNPNDPKSISSNRVEFLYEDKSKVLWIGTRGGGINKIDLKPQKFNNLTHSTNQETGFPQYAVMAINSDKKGNVWIGSDGGGLVKFDPRSNSYTHFNRAQSASSTLSSNRIWALLFDRDSILWVGTYQNGLFSIELKNEKYNFKQYQNIPSEPSSLSHNQVNALMEDNEGNIWIATANGLNKLEKMGNTYKISRYYHSIAGSNAFVDNYINSMDQDNKGRIWVGSYQSGLIEFDPKLEKFIPHIPTNTDTSLFLGKLKLLTIFEDSHNSLWIGTESSGLLQYDYNKNQYFPHPNNKSLSQNMINDIIEDDSENLWISSTRGISRYSLKTKSFSFYTINDGIEGAGFNRNATHKSANGTLYFGSNAGITYFKPEQVTNNPYIPKVTVTDFKILNHSVWDKSLTPLISSYFEKNEIVLTHKDYFFSIHFASFDYTNPTKNNYKYKLEGFNDDWIEIGTSNSATFTNLNPGTYIFKVAGSNNDKIWNDKPVELKIRIVPPIWKRTWFYALEALFIAFVIFLYIKYRTRKLTRDKRILEENVTQRTLEINNKKQELENTLEKLKSTQAQLIQSEKMASVGILTAGIAHEINNPLNYIQGGITALESYINENVKEHSSEVNPLIEIIEEGIKRTSQIVRTVNRFNRSIENSEEDCDIHAIIDNCLLMLRYQMTNRVSIEKNYHKTPLLLQANEGKLHQVFLNILTNAEQAIDANGKIIITTGIENSSFFITIADNGCGISKENMSKISDPFFTTKDPGKGTGLGLSIVYSIIQEHNGGIKYKSEVGNGTTVTILLPIKN